MAEDNLHTLFDAEIFRSGTWNGRKFSDEDLDDIVAAASAVGFTPPLKLGHGESEDTPAYGWVHNIRRRGDRLLADLKDIPSSLFEKIKGRAYDALSSEIFFDLRRNGQIFKRALKAVAVLGAQIPAVSNLKPLRELFGHFDCGDVLLCTEGSFMSNANDAGKLKDLEKAIEDGKKTIETMEQQQKQASEALKATDSKLEALQAENRTLKLNQKLKDVPPAYADFMRPLYEEGLKSTAEVVFFSAGKEEKTNLSGILDRLAAKLAHDVEFLFKEHSGRGDTKSDENPGKEIDKRAAKMIEANPKMAYSEAVNAVLKADQKLAQAYADS